MTNEKTEETTPAPEAPATQPDAAPQKEAETIEDGSKGLSLRDALEVAHEVAKDAPKAPEKTEKREVIRRSPADIQREEPSKEVAPKPSLQPPSEWSKEEKEDFLASSPKQQEAALRLHNKRQAKLAEIKAESSELQWAKDLVKEITPFIKTRAGKEPTHAQVINALKMVNEIDADAKGSVAAILKAKGLEVPKELLSNGADATDEKITPLQKELTEIKNKLAQREQAEMGAVMHQHWQAFESEKNAAGTARYPDINNTESGLRLASSIGSLVRGDTDLSKQFIANVKARIPDLTYPKLFAEAYKWYGGKVDDSAETPRTQATQKEIVRSSRAASSVPGRGAYSTSSGPVKKYKTIREAAAAALAEARESEGR